MATRATASQFRRHKYLLGHMNYARLLEPMDHPAMSEFRLAVEPVNLMAKSTPGFVWSLDDDSGRDEVPILVQDPLLMPQLSLWTDIDAVQHFAFKSGHAMYLKRRKEWFTSPDPPFSVCWWRPADEDYPTLNEAFHRCHHLKQHGPSAFAFDFKTARHFPVPDDS